jgi:hypothetical protein
MKKILFLFFIFLLLLPASSFAEEQGTLTLIKEQIIDDYIYRYYTDANGEGVHYQIYIPEPIQERIEGSHNKLFDVKKELYAVYYTLDLEQRLKELNNEYLLSHPQSKLVVKFDYMTTWREHQRYSLEHAKQMKERWEQLSEDRKDLLYDRSKGFFKDYTTLAKETSEIFKPLEEELIEKNQTVEKENTSYWWLFVLVIIFILVLLLFRKKPFFVFIFVLLFTSVFDGSIALADHKYNPEDRVRLFYGCDPDKPLLEAAGIYNKDGSINHENVKKSLVEDYGVKLVVSLE